MDIPVAANVLGTLGAVCWSIQVDSFLFFSRPSILIVDKLIPQIVINYRRHNATGLQPTMMMLWAWAGVPLGVYNIAENYNIALRIQPQILTLLSLVTWIQCYYYERRWSVLRSLSVVVPVACIMGAIQAGLIFAVRHAKQRDLHWPSILMAVASAALLAAGVLRHYVDVYLYRTVRGISFIFVGIDALGDVFSLVSVVFQPKLDVLGMVIYGTELLLWIGIFICGAHYNLRPWIAARQDQKRRTPGEGESSARAAAQVTEHEATVTSGIALHHLPSRRLASTEARAAAATMSTVTATKVTSMGSQYSGSGAPSVPNPTPTTEFSDGSELAPPDFNAAAVTKILAPIQELLNESADDARYPSPPINTPNAMSPAPSVASRYRVRSLSAVNDRLDKLKIEDRKFARRDADGTCSNTSVEPSIAEDDEYEMASISEVLSDASREKSHAHQPSMSSLSLRSPTADTDEGSVCIALGSPACNPRIEEYLTFSSKDLPTVSPAECIPSTLIENGNASFNTIVGPSSSRDSMKSEGVTEKSNWAEEVEENVDHACMRLEQLARDEHVGDPSKSVDEYYVARLERLLGSRRRAVPVKIEKIKASPSPSTE
ncbi:hypothetical protein NX059_004936 [Plenodomus lindquistii]|nr:hypothetical protein NX059_004936 [Plenodomus lindquistii]